jgi:hypothetical protein
MYSDEDLEKAVTAGIFGVDAVSKFRNYMADINDRSSIDEENIRLIASFNDVFVVVACLLVLWSSAWVAHAFHPALSMGVVAFLSWGLAEFFVLQRNMALPAIFLLLSFVVGVFGSVVLWFDVPSEKTFMLSAAVTVLATWWHWQRFKVPLTVAAGAVAIVIFSVSLINSLFAVGEDWILYQMFLGGVAIFVAAVVWDSADLHRVSRQSDIAFWLHLVSAPLIVHPLFASLGVLEGSQGLQGIFLIVGLYVFLTVLSLMLDRRAFMLAALAYVLFALSTLLKTYGLVEDSFALVGVCIGFSLLLLSGFWHKARYHLVSILPQTVQSKLPVTH